MLLWDVELPFLFLALTLGLGDSRLGHRSLKPSGTSVPCSYIIACSCSDNPQPCGHIETCTGEIMTIGVEQLSQTSSQPTISPVAQKRGTLWWTERLFMRLDNILRLMSWCLIGSHIHIISHHRAINRFHPHFLVVPDIRNAVRAVSGTLGLEYIRTLVPHAFVRPK